MNLIEKSQLIICFLCGSVLGISISWMILNPVNLSVNLTKRDQTITCSSSNVVATTSNPGGDAVNHKLLDNDASSKTGVKQTMKADNPDDLFHNVRVLCWIMTQPKNLFEKAAHVNATWGKRCNKILFASDTKDDDFPTIDINVEPGRQHLTAKTMQTFDYIYEHHADDADWFLKADDDTYVIMENLRFMLRPHSPDEPVYFGQHFRPKVRQGYFSGGAGYVLSKEALRRFGTRDKANSTQHHCRRDHGAEDVAMGKCMESLGVLTGESRDAFNRTRFHCFFMDLHLSGGFPDWYAFYHKYGAPYGPDSMSDLPISFHYVSPQDMHVYEYLVYHLRPHGFRAVHQDLNPSYVNYSLLTVPPPGISGSGIRTG